MNVYFIPGLGYDCRIFERLDLGAIAPKCIPWIEPKEDEAIRTYAQRLAAKIDDSEAEIVLIGHSLGGIMAQEISAIRKIDKIILIASLRSESELPLPFRMMRFLKPYRFFTKEISIKTVQFWGRSHGFETRAEQDLFKSMLGRQTNSYLQWALRALVNWKAPSVPNHTQLFRIHGKKDKTLSFSYIKNTDVVLPNAGHIPMFKQPELINKILLKELRT